MTVSLEEKEKRRLRKLAREQKKKSWEVVDIEKITQKKSIKETNVVEKKEFWFDLSFKDYLIAYVDEYINRSWYVKLNYQRNIIIDNVMSFFHTFLFQSINNIFDQQSVNSDPKKINWWIEKNFWINAIDWKNIFEKNMTEVQNKFFEDRNWFINVLHVDVWLWKTLMSVVSMLTIIKWIPYVHDILYKKSFKKDWLFDCEEFQEFTKYKKWTTNWLEIKDYKVNIICKKLLSIEFQEIIKRIWEDVQFEFLFNWTSPTWYDFDNNFKISKELSTLSYLAQMYYFDDVFDVNSDEHKLELLSSVWLLFSDFVLWNDEITEYNWNESTQEWKESLANSMWLFIIDEYWTDKFLFWEWKNWLKKEILWKIYWIWLTASVMKPSGSHTEFKSKFITKKEVLDELVEKWMYKSDWFLYKNINETNDEYNEITKSLRIAISEYKKATNIWIENWRKTLWLMMDSINSFLNNDDQSVEEFLSNMSALKQAFESQSNTKVTEYEKKKLKDLIDKFEDMKKQKMKTFYTWKIYDKFTNFDLTYLFEKNTIIIFDKWFSESSIKDFKDKLSKEWINFVTVEWAQKLNWTWNVLIWNLNELSKWINLQNFDNLLFMYLNQMTFDDVHQTIWRIDRIWSVSDKEIVFLSFVQDNTIIDKIIKKRKEISNKYSIENFLLQDNETINWLKTFWSAIEDIKSRYKELFQENKDKKNENWLNKDKLKLLNEHKEMIKEMIKDMQEQYQCYEEADSLIYWSSWEEELKLVKSIIWLAQ